jgi:uncharacterized protein YbaR (Trm112 family)
VSTTGPKRERIDWEDTPWVFITVATCPECGSPEYERIKTINAGEGARTRRVLCRSCNQPYRIGVELPDSGNDEWGIG